MATEPGDIRPKLTPGIVCEGTKSCDLILRPVANGWILMPVVSGLAMIPGDWQDKSIVACDPDQLAEAIKEWATKSRRQEALKVLQSE